MPRALLSVALAGLLWPGVAAAQAPEEHAPGERRATADGALYTRAQARRGREAFQGICAACHSPSEFQGSVFEFQWKGRSVFALFDQLRSTMPWDDPGGLEAQTYVDVIAYLLELNDFPAGDRALTTDEEALRAARIDRPTGGAGSTSREPRRGGGR